MAQLNQFVVKDALEIRDDILRTVKNGLRALDIANPNVGPNTDWFLMATALANELTVVGAGTIVKADAQMPDSAVGADLARIAAIYELSKQLAAPSVGNVVIEASATSAIETGRELTDSAGLRYEVTVGGNYANGASVPVRAIDAGFDTNHAEGDTLQWVSAPPFCSDKVTVDVGGLRNGINDEDDEVLRSRLFALLRNPPGAGNWEHVAEIAEASTASVQKAFVYPTHLGPGSTAVAVAAAPTKTSKSRVVAATTMSGIVEPYVKGKLPTHAEYTVTTVADVDTAVSIALAIPAAPTANPPGEGGGWVNGTPWPAPDGLTYFNARVISVNSATQFIVDAQTEPTENVTRIAWLSPLTWELHTALVTSYSGSAGNYTINIDSAFTGIYTGCYVWPECENAQTYVDAVLAHYALMGPGEKTANLGAFVRGFRHPVPGSSWPSQIGQLMTRALTDAGDEVSAAIFLHRNDGTTNINGGAGVLTPQVPASMTDAPNIFVPEHIGFYRLA